MSNNVTVELSCGHATTATIDDVFNTSEFECHLGWCNGKRSWVKFTPVDEGYNLRCRNCRYARTFGTYALVTTQTKAASHAIRKRHTVEVRLDQNVLSLIQPEKHMRDTELPPF